MKQFQRFLLASISLSILSCSETPIQKYPSTAPKADGLSMTCKDGSTRTGYTAHMVSGDQQCQKETQTCQNGMWSGGILHETCDNFTKSCDGQIHGSIQTGYLSPTAPCVEATRTCMNGIWNGPELFDFCSR